MQAAAAVGSGVQTELALFDNDMTTAAVTAASSGPLVEPVPAVRARRSFMIKGGFMRGSGRRMLAVGIIYGCGAARL